jgi:two-component system OmpR family sensor kinase
MTPRVALAARRPPMTIRLRLTIYWAAVLAAILLAAAIAVVQLFERQQSSALDAALLEEAKNTADQIERGGPSSALGILQRLSLETDVGPGRRVQIVTAHGVVANYGDIHTVPPPFDPRLPTHAAIVGNRDSRFAVVPMMYDGALAYLQSGVQARLVLESIDSLRNLLLLMLPMVLLLCVGGGYLLAGRALRPIESVTAELDAIGPANLGSRLTVPPVADEVARLTAVINALLERLERSSATERRFASDAAHELRTPLAVLRTGLEVALARDRSPAENRAALGAAHLEVLSLCRIADELLMLSRLNGEVMVDRQRLNLRALLTEIAATVGPLAQAREIKLSVKAPDDVFVNGNAAHLRRLIVNLLDNALKFTPAGGSIEVGLKSDANRAILRVADTGEGIHPAELPHIFDRFFRGAGSPGDGSGLGLSLCREIARAHGGDIAAANLPAGGCAFVVTLALYRDDPNRATAPLR